MRIQGGERAFNHTARDLVISNRSGSLGISAAIPPRLIGGEELAHAFNGGYGSLCLASAINWMKLSTGLIFRRSRL